MTTLSTNAGNTDAQRVPSRIRTLWTACAAHALHDGYTDLIYLLLPIWQAEFAIGYGALAFLRGLAAASMAGLQVPMGRVAEHIGGRTTLALGTALAAIGYVIAGYSAGLIGLCVALVVVGCGLCYAAPDRLGRGLARLSGRCTWASRHLQFRRRYRQGRDSERGFAVAGADVLASHAVGDRSTWYRCCDRGCDLFAGEPAADRAGNENRTWLVRRARRICAAAGRRDARFQRPHGISDLPAVPAARAGRLALDDRSGAGAGVHRWRRRKICLRLAGRAIRRAGYRAPDRGRHGRRHPGRPGAAACRCIGAVAALSGCCSTARPRRSTAPCRNWRRPAAPKRRSPFSTPARSAPARRRLFCSASWVTRWAYMPPSSRRR